MLNSAHGNMLGTETRCCISIVENASIHSFRIFI